jgi:hypothetical protein
MNNRMKYKIQAFLRINFPRLYRHIYKAVMAYFKFHYREREKHFGSLNPDKRFYVIRMRREKLGLMGYYNSILGHVRYALQRGLIPVVDMQNYRNPYLSDKTFRKNNAWEYYFDGPSDYSLQEVYKSARVILSSGETPDEAIPRRLYYRVYADKDVAGCYFDIIKRYMRINKEMEEHISSVYAGLFPQNARVLGVSSRGTDMIGFPGHSIQPAKEELLELAIDEMKKRDCDYIFLAVEESNTVSYFKKALGGRVLADERKRYGGFSGVVGIDIVSDSGSIRDNEEFLRGKEYLTTVALLSKCCCLFGTLIGATLGAIGMNQGRYEHVEIYDKGKYH